MRKRVIEYFFYVEAATVFGTIGYRLGRFVVRMVKKI